MSFPDKFVWGAAAASYQIEGAAHEDGKGVSVWDMMCREPGKIWSGDTGDIACDHYHRYEEDARIMGELGLHAYRLSISWPRVLPEGKGKINQKGLAFFHVDYGTGKRTLKDSAYWYRDVIAANGCNLFEGR